MAVAEVVIRRTQDARLSAFGVRRGVSGQPGGATSCQFSWACNGDMSKRREPGAWTHGPRLARADRHRQGGAGQHDEPRAVLPRGQRVAELAGLDPHHAHRASHFLQTAAGYRRISSASRDGSCGGRCRPQRDRGADTPRWAACCPRTHSIGDSAGSGAAGYYRTSQLHAGASTTAPRCRVQRRNRARHPDCARNA